MRLFSRPTVARADVSSTELDAGVLPLLSRLYFPLILLLIAAWTWRPLTGGEDFWAHIAVGRWIWQQQSVPRETLWLWSAPPQNWIAHSWLTELVLYGLTAIGGFHLVLLATIILVAIPFFWFWKLWSRRAGISAFAPFFFALAIWCASARFQARPEIFSALFLSLLLLFLIEWPRSAGRAGCLAIVALFALWANFHGGVALGIAIWALTIIGETVQQKLQRENLLPENSARSVWKMAAVGGACVLAVNLNPYGFNYWQTLTQVGGAMFKMIDEWKPPLMQPGLPITALIAVFLVVLVALAAWSRNPQRRWAQLLWLVFASALFLTARRNLWPCVLISVAVCADNARGLSTLGLSARSARARVLAGGLSFAWLLSWILIAISPQAIAFKNGWPTLRATAPELPRKVADAVLTQKLPDPIFNDYLRSGYFHWRFNGRRRLYIDLQNVYPASVLENYFEIIQRSPKGIAEFERLEINTVIVGKFSPTGRFQPLASYLDSQPKLWKPIYRGAEGAVWVRRSAIGVRVLSD